MISEPSSVIFRYWRMKSRDSCLILEHDGSECGAQRGDFNQLSIKG